MILSLGWDPSTQGATWALLNVSPTSRDWIAYGTCIDDEGIAERLRLTKDLGERQGTPVAVCVETPMRGLNSKKGDESGARKKAQNLMATAVVAGYIRGYSKACGLDTYALPSWTIRTHLGLHGKTTDRMVADALRLFVPNWPKNQSDDHDRDAGAAAVAGAVHRGVSRGWT
jgi:hypothetical protein